MYFYHPLVTSDKLGACAQSALRQTAHHSLSTLSDLTLACDDRLIFATNFLHLFTKKKNGMFVLKRGERARMGKMCLHGPWEIPPLFAITVTFQNSAVSVVPVKEWNGVISLSHDWQGSDSERCWGGNYPYQKDQSALIWGVKRKIKSLLLF